MDTAGQGGEATITAAFTVANAGARDGDEVAQVYVRQAGAGPDRPLKKLHGFQRVSVAKGAAQRVSVTFKVSDLAAWDDAAKAFRVAPGDYEILVGASSADIRLRQTIHVAP